MTPAKSRRPPDLRQRSTLAGEAAAASAEVESALATPADLTAGAFFDVDNTLMQGASIFHLARGLHRRKFFTTRDVASAMWRQAYFRLVGVEDPDHVAKTRASALAFIEGHPVAELEGLGEEICAYFSRWFEMNIIGLRISGPRRRADYLAQRRDPKRAGDGSYVYPLDEEDMANAYLGAIEAVGATSAARYDAVFIVGDETGAEHDLSKAERLIGWKPQAHKLLEG